MRSTCLFIEGAKKALFIGIGGGGDVASATVLAKSFERCGGIALIGSFVWERFSVDPFPGPVRAEELQPLEMISKHLGWVVPETIARRPCGVIKPQASRAAEVVGKVLFLDLWAGPRELAKELKEFVDREGLDVVVGVDVGGDSLAMGCEEDLWSPLADAIGVAMLSMLSNSILMVVSPGADGELSPSYVGERISEIAKLGGFLGGYVFGKSDEATLSDILKRVHTEASSIPLRALQGFCGELSIRRGSRIVRVGITSCVSYALDPRIVLRATLAKLVVNANSLEEANEILHRYGVYTELDLERDLYEEMKAGHSITSDLIKSVRDRGRQRLGPCKASEFTRCSIPL